MATRQRIALAHGYTCSGCGLMWRADRDQIDHTIPREQGGSNEDSNLKPMCDACHKAKTAREAAARRGGGR
ncbi:HNH endonuclease signature motif containing protein [Methylibium sp.]|uniref:HNH endonuclease n=1 Tax=Methylibium sp. TaxID=2067992 RepID=UPI00182E4C28|nr:HNH endonuclease signature motif containing protein [Methylibium sp.]MBA3588291.1 HNH endonuclease [Methylibium sp.]